MLHRGFVSESVKLCKCLAETCRHGAGNNAFSYFLILVPKIQTLEQQNCKCSQVLTCRPELCASHCLPVRLLGAAYLQRFDSEAGRRHFALLPTCWPNERWRGVQRTCGCACGWTTGTAALPIHACVEATFAAYASSLAA